MTNLAAVLPATYADHPDRAAVRQGDLVLSYADLTAAAGQIVTFLRKERIGAGDRVAVTPEDLRAFAKERVAAYKYPRVVWLVDELPKGPTGKILRHSVKPPRQ